MTIFGGNSGYIGYSESKRSLEAKNSGKFPKSVFKKEYNISEKKFKELEDRGVIYVSEWHHTSKFGNRTNFYAIDNYVLFYMLTGDKEKAYYHYKISQPSLSHNLKFNKKSYQNKLKFLSDAQDFFWGKVLPGETLFFKNQKLFCLSLTKRRKAPVFQFVN